MEPTVANTSPPRATIILDYSALMGLRGTVAPALQAPDVAYAVTHYIDQLRFLAKHGFEIVIPEVISYRVAKLLGDKTDLSWAFKDDEELQGRNSVKDFLHRVARGEIPHIRIVPAKAGSPADKYISAIREANINTLETGRETHKRQRMRDDIIHARIMRAHNRSQVSSTDEIKRMIHDEYKSTHETGPVFVWTENGKLRESAAESGVDTITNRQFIYTLTGAGLLTKAGFAAESEAQQLYEDMWRGGRPLHSYETDSRPVAGDYMLMVLKSPFYALLYQLAEEKGRDPEPEADPAVPEHQPAEEKDRSPEEESHPALPGGRAKQIPIQTGSQRFKYKKEAIDALNARRAEEKEQLRQQRMQAAEGKSSPVEGKEEGESPLAALIRERLEANAPQKGTGGPQK